MENNDTKLNTQWVIYMLVWFFLGAFGIHRFVAGKIGSGFGMLALQIIGWLTMIFLVGFLFLFAVWIWWLVDGIRLLMSKFEEENGKVIQVRVPE